jgi:hypothetical protein
MTTDTIEFAEPSTEILHPGSRKLFRYWESIRGERAAPGREAIDLKAIKEMVPWLFLMERNWARKSFAWRLAGTEVCQLWRRELTGADVLTNWDRFERDTAFRLLEGVSVNLQPCAFRMRLITSLGHHLPVEMIALPIRAKGDIATHIFGAIMPFRDLSMHGYDSVSSVQLLSAHVIWTEPVPGDSLIDEKARKRGFSPFQVINGGRNS